MKIAIVYDRVNKWGGAEQVVLALHEIFPDAPLYTAVYDEVKAPWAKVFPHIYTSFLQKLPILKDNHELLGWLTPIAFETLDFSGYNLVVSVTSEAAKGIITSPATKHICYCLTPTRYLWSGYNEYLENPPKSLSWIPFYKTIAKPFLTYAKNWDKIASQRPDEYFAISHVVKKRIKKYYGRDSKVIYPPVNIANFQKPNSKNQTKIKLKNLNLDANSYFLVVSRLVPYKKVDVVIEAFNELGLPLVVVGTGSEEGKLRKIAGKNIKFAGFVLDEDLVAYYQGAKALIHPQDEDFGITSVEAQAAGVPVIAYKSGGALDTVIDGKTGVFFEKQEKKSLISAIKEFSNWKLNSNDFIYNSLRFSKESFKQKFKKLVF